MDRSLLVRILRQLHTVRTKLARYLLTLILAALCSVGVPLLIQRLIDHGLRVDNTRAVVGYGCAALGLGIATAALNTLASRQGISIGTQLTFELRTALFRHLQRQPLAFFARAQAGALQSRLGSDVMGAQTLIQTLFGSVAANIVTVVAALIAMMALSPSVTLLVLLPTPFLLLPVRRFVRRVHQFARAQATARTAHDAYLAERLNVGGALLQATFGHRDRHLDGYVNRAAAIREADIARNGTFYVAEFILAVLGLVGYTMVFMLGGGVSVGTVVALAALVKVAYDPIIVMATRTIGMDAGVVAFERVFEVLDHPPTIADPPVPQPFPRPVRELEFRGVWFRHPTADESTLASLHDETATTSTSTGWSLRNVAFTASAGQMSAIVGPTGAGKTTLTLLAARLYDPTTGSIRLNGVDVRELALDDVHAAVGMVTQDAYVLHESLAANLRIAQPDATDRELLEACEVAHLGDLVSRLPDGFDTVLGDRGYRLSGGERARVALARVFLKRADIVVLDEATAHLDTQTERAIQAAIHETLADRILLVVAHRLSTIRHADQILVLDHGKIVERGTHTELLAAGSAYTRLHALTPEATN